eukprot:9771427-Alexandrium_andersonii.AAC.1
MCVCQQGRPRRRALAQSGGLLSPGWRVTRAPATFGAPQPDASTSVRRCFSARGSPWEASRRLGR